MQDFDEALKSYSEGPGAPELERRVLERTRAAHHRRLGWLVAIPALVVVALVALLFRPARERVKPAFVHVNAPVHRQPAIQPAVVRRRQPSRRRPPPESVLVAFLENRPELAAHLLAGDEPISIEPLRIQELP